MADFAPYQDVTPERVRALSPPPKSPPPQITRSPPPQHSRNASRNIGTAAVHSPTSALPPRQEYFQDEQHRGRAQDQDRDQDRDDTAREWGSRRADVVDLFETRLGLRMDLEACLAYLVLPPVGGVALLILETTSDYVRFHAWQSSLLFTFMFVVHVLFSWSAVLSWLLFMGDVALIALLTFHAYRHATTLDRFEMPFFGPLASSILDDE